MVRDVSPAYPTSFQDLNVHDPHLERLPAMPAGSWQKEKTLAEALYGKVYLAKGLVPNMPDKFVLKVMPRSKVFAQDRGLESALNELCAAMALARVQVPGIARTYFVAQDKDKFYLASEYCEGGELFTVLSSTKGGKIPSQTLQEVMFQILSSVAALHKAGVAHRDLSLENVVVHKDGCIRLIDFGQSLLVHAAGDDLQEAFVQLSHLGVSGKKFYRPPEARLTNCVAHSAKKLDVFACGVMLYVLAVGEYPFDPSDYSSMFPEKELDSGRCFGLRRRLQSKNLESEMPKEMLNLMEQLMAPNPEKRISAEEALAHPWLCEMEACPASTNGKEESLERLTSTSVA